MVDQNEHDQDNDGEQSHKGWLGDDRGDLQGQRVHDGLTQQLNSIYTRIGVVYATIWKSDSLFAVSR